MKGAMTRRVAGRADEADAGCNLGLTAHLANVFPGRENGLNAPRQSLPGFRQPVDDRRVGPELVFHVGDDDLRVREYRLVCVLFHQPENVIGMTVRDENGVDRGGVGNPPLFFWPPLYRGWGGPSPR